MNAYYYPYHFNVEFEVEAGKNLKDIKVGWTEVSRKKFKTSCHKANNYRTSWKAFFENYYFVDKVKYEKIKKSKKQDEISKVALFQVGALRGREIQKQSAEEERLCK